MINDKKYIECLENISVNFDKMKDDNFYMREQLYEFKEEDKVYINFKECHVAICPNGGLIAICKKKGYLDTTKNTKINNYIIVMYQTSKKKYLIPIDWSYKTKYFILFDFNEKEQLYGICNDGTIYKIDILTQKAVEKITSNLFLRENIEKAKLYEEGFIALTKEGNFYYVNDIKNPTPQLIFQMKSLLRFSNDVDFLIIPQEFSKSKKNELLITNEKKLGVIHVEINEDAIYTMVPYDEDMNNMNNLIYQGISVIKKDKLEPCFIDDAIIKGDDNTLDKKEQKKAYMAGNLRCIASLAISPSKKNIAFYDPRGIVFFFSSTLDLNLEKNPRKCVEIKKNDDLSVEEIREQEMVLNFGEGFQFLFCGEDAVILAGLRSIIIVHKDSTSITYRITDSLQNIALKGMLFCKCISEIDGVRYLTNDGIYLISQVNKDLADICSTFTSNYSKQLVQAYQYYLDKAVNSEKSLREIEDHLIKAIMSVEIAAANIFWVDDPNDNEKKEVQLFVLKAAQYGKVFVQKDEFNFDKFLEICKDIRCVNNLRNSKSARLITYNEYKSLEPKDLVKKLMRNLNFEMAFELCNYLDYNYKKVYQRYAIAKIKKLSDKAKEEEEEVLYRLLFEKLRTVPKISFIKLAKKAFKYHKKTLGMRFLENEKSDLSKIPQYIELMQWKKALEISENLFDANIINTVLHKIYKKEGIDNFITIVSYHPKIKTSVIQFLKNNEDDKIEKYLTKMKNPEELFFYYLEQYFQKKSLSERKKLISLARNQLLSIDNTVNPNFEYKFYKNYLETLENNINVKIEAKNKKAITEVDDYLSFDISIYDLYRTIVKKIRDNNYSIIESLNKNIGFSNEGMTIMKLLAFGDNERVSEIKLYIENNKNNVRKCGLTNLNVAEIFFKYKAKDKVVEFVKLINEPEYINYKISMLEYINAFEAELEIIISDKNIENKKCLIDGIIKRKPDLLKKVDEFCEKYKVTLKE